MPLRRALPLVAALTVAALVTAPGAPRPAAERALPQNAFAVPTAGQLGPQPVPGDAALLRTAGKDATVPTGAFARAKAQAGDLPVLGPGRDWDLHGPTNIGGRVLDVVVDPTRADSIFVATATGGVWHSGDAGKTFDSVWPDDLVQTIGALAITPTGTLYAGTGEAGPGGGSLTYGGTGLYRSTDLGATWQLIGLAESERIGRIIVDPTNPLHLFVAANGPLFSEGGERGLYRSLDGGDTWIKVLAGSTPTTGAVDVAFDPDSSQVLYATMWDRIRRPGNRDYTGGGSALYRSVNHGATWVPVGTTFFGPGITTVGRLGVAAAPGGIVYVLSSTVDGLTGGFYVSADYGDTFVPKSFDDALVTGGFVYAWWFGRVYVDPKSATHVYATGVNLSESKDGGSTFSAPTGFHADQHGMAWDPKVPDRVYLGNDGGVYRSDDNGATWEHGEYMPWNQLFSVDVSQQRPARIVGGLQDNGGNRSWDNDDETSPAGWNDITGGDGTEMRINPENDQIVYGCSQYGACAVSTQGGKNMSAFDTQIIGDRKNWLTPIEFDPADPSTVYTASSIVHRSTDDGQNWTPISGDLTDGEGGSTETNPLFRNYDTVSTIAVTPADTGFLLVGTDDGHLWYSHDNAANPLTSWTESTDADLPEGYVTSVAIDPQHPDVAYAAFSGFRAGTSAATVFRSADRGVTWDDISGNLPSAPVGKVLPVGTDLIVATDVGVFITKGVSSTKVSATAKGAGGAWYRLGSGLPMTPVWDLAYQAKTHTVYAASFGRGAYSLPLTGLVVRPPILCGCTPPLRPPPGGPTIPTTGLPGPLPLLALAGAAGAALLTRRRRAAYALALRKSVASGSAMPGALATVWS
ncbi:MAG: hypothetical protein QOE45_707 [Frankiaceae bacterium]|jgi:hypothetical protein|nr:hypothetical protein [Frankiaceae bacterium]